MSNYISKSEKGIPIRVRELGFDNYKQFLKSDNWKDFKNKFYKTKVVQEMVEKFGQPVCEFCCTKGKLNIHHWTYKKLGNDVAGYMSLICDECHNTIHSMNRKHNLWHRTRMFRRAMIRAGKSIHSTSEHKNNPVEIPVNKNKLLKRNCG